MPRGCQNAHSCRKSRQLGEEERSLPFSGYLCFLYLAWTVVWVHGVYPWANKTSAAATLTYALINFTFRLLILVLPVVWYLRYVDNVDVVEYLRLKQCWRRGVVVGLTLSVINFLVSPMARHGPPVWSSAHVTWNRTFSRQRLHVSIAAEEDHHCLPTTCPDEAGLSALDPTHTRGAAHGVPPFNT